MTIKKKKVNRNKLEIDLTGPQGNAFHLLAIAQDLSKQLGLKWETIHKEMTSGDYDNLIKVFDNHFGSIVDLLQ